MHLVETQPEDEIKHFSIPSLGYSAKSDSRFLAAGLPGLEPGLESD